MEIDDVSKDGDRVSVVLRHAQPRISRSTNQLSLDPIKTTTFILAFYCAETR